METKALAPSQRHWTTKDRDGRLVPQRYKPTPKTPLPTIVGHPLTRHDWSRICDRSAPYATRKQTTLTRPKPLRAGKMGHGDTTSTERTTQ